MTEVTLMYRPSVFVCVSYVIYGEVDEDHLRGDFKSKIEKWKIILRLFDVNNVGNTKLCPGTHQESTCIPLT